MTFVTIRDMNFKVVLMGFAYTHEPYLTQEWSHGFARGEADTELALLDKAYGNFTFLGKVNAGENQCKKDGVRSPVETNIAYYGDYVRFNTEWRKRKTERGMSNIKQLCYPTVAIITDESLEVVGMIAIPDRDWRGVKADFIKNMKFFLEPEGSLRPPNKEIIEIDFNNWRRQLGK